MSQPFACPHCNNACRWKPERAGRRLECRCGRKFWMPDTPEGRVKRDGGHRARLAARKGKAAAIPASDATDLKKDTAPPFDLFDAISNAGPSPDAPTAPKPQRTPA